LNFDPNKHRHLWRLSRYMFVQNFIKLSAAVHELSCYQRKKLSDDAENNTAVASAASKKTKRKD